MPDLTSGTYEILGWLVGGGLMIFLMFRFSGFLASVAGAVIGAVGGLVRR